jgi:hypothetical protein
MPAETADARPFTDPGLSAWDLHILDAMRTRLARELRHVDPCPAGTTLYLTEDGERMHRIVLLNRAALLDSPTLAAVGFFGQRWPQADHNLMDGVDGELIAEMHAFPGMYSYSSLELPDGNWANLVLLRQAQEGRHWRESARHAHAAYQIAPRYYLSIRLHNALLSGGLAGPPPALARSTYYDFAGGWWQAVRQICEENLTKHS